MDTREAECAEALQGRKGRVVTDMNAARGGRQKLKRGEKTQGPVQNKRDERVGGFSPQKKTLFVPDEGGFWKKFFL